MKISLRKILYRSFCLVALAGSVLYSCQERESLSIPYPEAPPADSIDSFLPGIVCRAKDSVDFNAAFSPDAKSFYFTRTLNRKWDIYVTRHDGASWSMSGVAGFCSPEYSEADPAFGPDGTLYYISDRPKNESDTLRDFDIWFVRPLPNGDWSPPENLGVVNTDSTEYYVSFAGDGNLYFASSRVGGFGAEDIYISKLVNGNYSEPENLGPQINSVFSDHDPCLPKDEGFMIYTSVEREDGLGEGDLYYSIKEADGKWSPSTHMSTAFNSSTYEYCSYFSPDYKYFFFSSKRDVKWTSVHSLPEEIRALMK